MKFISIILLIFTINFAHASTTPAFNSKINNSISGLIKFKGSKVGFAANDPRYAVATQAISRTATRAGLRVATVGLAGVSWPALLVGAGIYTVATVAVPLGVERSGFALWNPDGTVTISGLIVGAADLKNFPILGTTTYPQILEFYGTNADVWFANTSSYLAARHIKTISISCPAANTIFCNGNVGIFQKLNANFNSFSSANNDVWVNVYQKTVQCTIENQTCYVVVYDYVPPSGVTLYPPKYTPSPMPPLKAFEQLPASYLAQPLAEESLALAHNTLIQKTAEEEPTAVLAAPELFQSISPSEISNWKTQSSNNNPTVGDFISYSAAPAAEEIKIPNPASDDTATPAPGSETSNVKAVVEWGTFTPPELEPEKNAGDILDPLFNFFPNTKNFQIPAHASECPRPVFNIFNRSVEFNALCEFTDPAKNTVRGIMILVFSICSLLIILRA